MARSCIVPKCRMNNAYQMASLLKRLGQGVACSIGVCACATPRLPQWWRCPGPVARGRFRRLLGIALLKPCIYSNSLCGAHICACCRHEQRRWDWRGQPRATCPLLSYHTCAHQQGCTVRFSALQLRRLVRPPAGLVPPVWDVAPSTRLNSGLLGNVNRESGVTIPCRVCCCSTLLFA